MARVSVSRSVDPLRRAPAARQRRERVEQRLRRRPRPRAARGAPRCTNRSATAWSRKADQPRVVAAHVEQAERLGVQPELRPGVDLEQLLERADPARQRDEAVRELGHQRLALVHRADDVQLGQPGMGDLPVDERLRDHADHLAARRRAPRRPPRPSGRRSRRRRPARSPARPARRPSASAAARRSRDARRGSSRRTRRAVSDEGAVPPRLARHAASVRPTSSRPTTSAACTASRSTATSPSRSGARSPGCWPACGARRCARPADRARARHAASPRPSSPAATATAWPPRARTCSTPGWSAPRCSTSSSARASSTAA